MIGKLKYNVEYKRGQLHPETGEVYTPASYNELAKRQEHNGWRVMPDWEVILRTELENNMKEGAYQPGGIQLMTGIRGKLEFEAAFHREMIKSLQPEDKQPYVRVNLDALPKLDPKDIAYFQQGITLEYQHLNPNTMKQQEAEALHTATSRRLPNHTVVMGQHIDPTTTTASYVTVITPKEERASGITDPITGKDVPIGYMRIQSSSVDDLIKKINFAASLIEGTQTVKGSDFGSALVALKAGKCVARRGWNGKGMFLFLLPAGTVPTRAIHDPALRAVIEREVGGDTFEALGSIRMWTTNSEGRKAVLTGWLASQTDMLSEDWEIIEHK